MRRRQVGELRSAARWDREFGAGKYAYLHKPSERARLTEIAAMIDRSIREGGACEIVDIGCGEGLLLGQLAGLDIVRYVGLDISAVALSRLPVSTVPVVRVHAPLSQWDGAPAPAARRILVASEVLYYEPTGVHDLARVAHATAAEVIVSCVGGHPDKPNWTSASAKLWREMAQTGWPVIEQRQLGDGQSGIVWDIARYRV